MIHPYTSNEWHSSWNKICQRNNVKKNIQGVNKREGWNNIKKKQYSKDRNNIHDQKPIFHVIPSKNRSENTDG